MTWVEELPDPRPAQQYFITKPYAARGGTGIQLWRGEQLKHVEFVFRQVVQEYIDRPLLLRGLKFDFRLYVVVTSVRPLRAYIYKDGLVRFCTAKYSAPDRSNTANVHMHLTNYHLNKDSRDFVGEQTFGRSPDQDSQCPTPSPDGTHHASHQQPKAKIKIKGKGKSSKRGKKKKWVALPANKQEAARAKQQQQQSGGKKRQQQQQHDNLAKEEELPAQQQQEQQQQQQQQQKQ